MNEEIRPPSAAHWHWAIRVSLQIRPIQFRSRSRARLVAHGSLRDIRLRTRGDAFLEVRSPERRAGRVRELYRDAHEGNHAQEGRANSEPRRRMR